MTEKLDSANLHRIARELMTQQEATRGPIPQTVLEEAAHVVDVRGKSYGDPTTNHTRTAEMWSAYLGVRVTAHDVCMLNVLQKVSRQRHRPKRDNLVDVCGFARNAEIVGPCDEERR